MKYIKWLLIAVVSGQLFSLWSKDKELQKKTYSAPWLYEKGKVLLNALITFNTTLLTDRKQTIKEYDQEQLIERLKKEKVSLQEKIHEFETHLSERSDEELPAYYSKIEDQYNQIKQKTSTWKETILEHDEVKNILRMLWVNVETARKRLPNKTKES